MLRKLGIGIAVIAATAVLAVAVSPYFVGRRAESEFKAQLALFNARQPGVQLQLQSYRRGFYSSEAKLAVTPGVGTPPQSLQVWALLLGSGPATPEIHLHIYHGPIPFAAFASQPVNLTPVLGALEFLGADLPGGSFLGTLKLDVYAVRYFSGRTSARVRLPPGVFNLGMMSTRWQGGELDLGISRGDDHLSFNGSFGPTRLSFENPRSATIYNSTLRDLQFAGERTRVTDSVWIGHSEGSWDGLEVRANGALLAHLGPWRWHDRSTVSTDRRWFGASLDSEQHGGSIRGWHWSDLTTHAALQHLDVHGLELFLQQARRMQPAANMQVQQNSLAQLLAALAAVVKPQTDGNLRIALTAADGNFTTRAHLQFDAAAADAHVAYTGPTLEQTLDLQADIDFSGKLVSGFAAQVIGQDAAQKTTQTLQNWLNRGLLQARAGGAYHAHLAWRGGRLEVNGQTPNTGGKQI
jgi:uncharacterized protein YdgA (DUF945 family)